MDSFLLISMFCVAEVVPTTTPGFWLCLSLIESGGGGELNLYKEFLWCLIYPPKNDLSISDCQHVSCIHSDNLGYHF